MIKRLTWIAGIAVTMIMVALYVAEPRPIQQARAAILDSYMRAAPRAPDPEAPIHIIDIDEASLDALGQWPWPRTYLAELTERLFDLGAVVVGFDVLFTEPDRTSPDLLARSLGRYSGDAPIDLQALQGLPNHDEVFADAVGSGPVVLALSGAPSGTVPVAKAGIAYTGRLPEQALTAYTGALAPLPVLEEAAAGLGSISLATGADGITRSVPMLALFAGAPMPSFTAELLRVAQGAGGHILRTSEAQGEVSGGAVLPVAMRTGALEYPLDDRGHFRIHFSQGSAHRVTSAQTLLAGDRPDDALRQRIEGKIVLVGSSAQALFDIRATPLSSEIPGVHLHADILEQIINGEFLIRPDWTRGFEIVLIFLIGLLVTSFAALERPVPGMLAALGSVVAVFAGGWFAFLKAGLILDPLEPAVTALAVYLPATTISVFGKERARRAIRERFGYFLPTEVVDAIASDPDEKLTPTGASREVSVVFVDMRRFSTITEKMAPADVVRLLNIYISEVADALSASGATIDKFMGDAVMAFWNAPLLQPDHVRRSAQAVVDVDRAILRAGARLAELGMPRISVGVGVNTGFAFVGLMGSAERLNYSCVGDSITLASRFERLNRDYGTWNIVGEDTVAHVPDGHVAVEIDRVVVRGRSAAARVSTILPRNDATSAFANAVDAVRLAYLRKEWPLALEHCRRLAAIEVDGIDPARLAAVYEARISSLSQKPLPPEWDGTADAVLKM